MSAILAVLLGLLIGAVLGLVGAGGSIIAVPALIYGVGMNPARAIPASLIVVGLGALAAVLPRLRQGIDWTTAVVGVAGIPTAWIGTAVSRMLDPNVLMLIFAALMVIAALRMLTAQRNTIARQSIRGSFRSHASRALGVGALVRIPDRAARRRRGLHHRACADPAAGSGDEHRRRNVSGHHRHQFCFSAHIQNLTRNWPILLTFAASAIVGSLLAARLATRLPDKHIRITFAITVLVVAAFVAIGSGYALATA